MIRLYILICYIVSYSYINYIKNTKPDWYPAEGGWVDIDTLYSNYKEFELTIKKISLVSEYFF